MASSSSSSSPFLLPMQSEYYSVLLGTSHVPAHKLTHLNLNRTEVGDRKAQVVALLLANETLYPNLTSLDLVNTSLTTKSCTGISQAIEKNSTLRVLRIGEERRATPSAGLSSIINSFLKNRGVNSLTIQYSCLTMDNLKSLCKVLSKNPSLTTLNLNSFFSESFGKFLEPILKAPYLKRLDLCQTAVGSVYVNPDGFAKGLSSATSLQSLILNRCGMSDRFVAGLSTGLRNNTSVTELSLNGTSITPDGAGTLVQAILHTQTVTHLDLEFLEAHTLIIDGAYVRYNHDNAIKWHLQGSWDHFTDLFASHRTLQSINLSNRESPDNNSPIISLKPSFAICSNSFTHLRVCNVQFAESAIEILFNALPQGLESLDLKGCFSKLDPNCRSPSLLMRRIVTLIETSTVLTELSFGGENLKKNHLWDQDSMNEERPFMPLAEALKANTALTSLSICDIELELPDTEKLCEALAENCGVSKFVYTPRYSGDVQFLTQISELFAKHLPINHTLLELSGVADASRFPVIGTMLERNRYRAEILVSLFDKLLTLAQEKNWLQKDDSEQASEERTPKRQRKS